MINCSKCLLHTSQTLSKFLQRLYVYWVLIPHHLGYRGPIPISLVLENGEILCLSDMLSVFWSSMRTMACFERDLHTLISGGDDVVLAIYRRYL